MSDSKIQVKVGIVEFSGEGNQDWLAKQLDKILEKVPELLKIEVSSSKVPDTPLKPSEDMADTSFKNLSILNIAGKLGCKSASDLAIAAAGYLHFVEGKPLFSRDDLSSTMKKATGIYKDTMLKNLTSTISQLEKNSIFNKAGNNFSVNATKVTELNAILSR